MYCRWTQSCEQDGELDRLRALYAVSGESELREPLATDALCVRSMFSN